MSCCSPCGRASAITTAGVPDAATSATAFCPAWVMTTSAHSRRRVTSARPTRCSPVPPAICQHHCGWAARSPLTRAALKPSTESWSPPDPQSTSTRRESCPRTGGDGEADLTGDRTGVERLVPPGLWPRRIAEVRGPRRDQGMGAVVRGGVGSVGPITAHGHHDGRDAEQGGPGPQLRPRRPPPPKSVPRGRSSPRSEPSASAVRSDAAGPSARFRWPSARRNLGPVSSAGSDTQGGPSTGRGRLDNTVSGSLNFSGDRAHTFQVTLTLVMHVVADHLVCHASTASR